MVLGHEIGGYGLVGGEVQPVGCLAFRACGRCQACRTGNEQLCAATAHLGHGAGWEGQNPGGMAEYCPVWSEHLYALPPTVTTEDATFLDGLAVAVHAVSLAGLFPGDRVLLLGGGPIGLLIAQTARALAAAAPTVTDVYDMPLECARELGLADTVNLAQPEREVPPGAYGAVFDTTGDRGAQELGLQALRPGGTMILMAGAAEGLALTPSTLAGERRLMTCSNHRYEDFEIALRLLASGQVQVRPMVTHRFDLDDAAKAFAVAANKVETGALKVILSVA
jgi:2-desacetyl-2-hydroxyethyl bacteriochlorophyllide A dehydrogenase